MVSGMLIPVLVALFSKSPNTIGALVSMISGGTLTLVLIISSIDLPLGLDANIFGIVFSVLSYFSVAIFSKKNT